MGFFKSVGGIFKDIAPTVGGALLNPALGTAIGTKKVIDEVGGEAPTVAPVEDSFTRAMNRQNSMAQDFSDKKGALKNDLTNMNLDLSRRDLTNQMKTSDQNMNRRGLLYSGFGAKARNDIASQRAIEEAEMKKQVNMDVDNLDRQQLYEAMQAGMNLQDMETQKQNANYDQLFGNELEKNAAFGQLFGGLGSGVGTGLARRS